MPAANLKDTILRAFRAANITQRELSRRSGVKYSTLRDYLHSNNDTSSENVVALCNALGIEIQLDPKPRESDIAHNLSGMSFGEIKLSGLLQAKCLLDSTVPPGLKEFADNPSLWGTINPTGEELEFVTKSLGAKFSAADASYVIQKRREAASFEQQNILG